MQKPGAETSTPRTTSRSPGRQRSPLKLQRPLLPLLPLLQLFLTVPVLRLHPSSTAPPMIMMMSVPLVRHLPRAIILCLHPSLPPTTWFPLLHHRRPIAYPVFVGLLPLAINLCLHPSPTTPLPLLHRCRLIPHPAFGITESVTYAPNNFVSMIVSPRTSIGSSTLPQRHIVGHITLRS